MLGGYDVSAPLTKPTTNNVGKRMAVILDGVVITAPRINSAITGGSGIITGDFDAQEAADSDVRWWTESATFSLDLSQMKSIPYQICKAKIINEKCSLWHSKTSREYHSENRSEKAFSRSAVFARLTASTLVHFYNEKAQFFESPTKY